MKVFHGLNIPAKYWGRSARDDELPECKFTKRYLCDVCAGKINPRDSYPQCGLGKNYTRASSREVEIYGKTIKEIEGYTRICKSFKINPAALQTLCANCERATRGRCPWHERFEPYPGWEAIRNDVAEGQSSYRVISCPGYVPTWEEVELVKEKGKRKRLMVRAVKLKAEKLDSDGCTALMETVMKKAKKDYLLFPNLRREVASFIRGYAYISDPEGAVQKLKDLARIYDLNPKLKKRLLAGDESLDGYVPPKPTAKHSARWRVFNQWTQLEFAECTRCGQESEKPYPRLCPGCGALMVECEPAEEQE